jgi:hypothetical protein
MKLQFDATPDYDIRGEAGFMAGEIGFKIIWSDEADRADMSDRLDLSDKSDTSDGKDNDGQLAKNYWAAWRVSKAAKFSDGTDDL